MRLLGGLGSALRVMADAMDPKRDALDPRWWADASNLSTAGVVVTEQRVSQLGAVQAVRFGISGAMSSLPIMVFQEGEAGARVEQPDHPLMDLLAHRPNGRQTPAEFFGEIAWHLAYWRNAYCLIHPGVDYAIGELEIIHPRRKVKIERRDGRVYYAFNTLDQTATQVTYRDDEIWHIRGNPLKDNGLEGEGIWESAREVFGRAIAVHEYGDIWFKNSGQTGGTLEHPGTFKDNTERDRFLDNWRAMATGQNRHRDRLLTHGVKYNPLKVTNAEAQLLETEQRCDLEIFGLWSYPPHRAARLEQSTNNNIEQQSQDFVVYCLAPLAIAIEQAIERDLLLGSEASEDAQTEHAPDGDLFVEFDFDALLRALLKDRYAAYMMGRQGEWLSANDVRRKERMNPRTDPGGDEYKNPVTKGTPNDKGSGSAGDAGSGDGAGQPDGA